MDKTEVEMVSFYRTVTRDGSGQLVVDFEFNPDDTAAVEKGAADRALRWVKKRLGLDSVEPIRYGSRAWVFTDEVVERYGVEPATLDTAVREEFADQGIVLRPSLDDRRKTTRRFSTTELESVGPGYIDPSEKGY